MAQGLEAIGAAVESERPGEAFFAIDGLRGLHGGSSGGVVTAAREALGEGRAIGIGPTRFRAFLAAGDWPRPVPVAALRTRLAVSEREAGELIEALERLGIETLRAFAHLSADQVADRFGPLGLRALRLCRDDEKPLQPRSAHEDLSEEIELPEGTAGRQLDRALELLVDRLLAAPRRKERTLLALRLGARLAAGGSWSVEQGLGRPSASPRVLRNVLVPRLEDLPGPATSLRLRALGLGPPVRDQLELAVGGTEPRRRRLGAAVREVRAAQGAGALLKVLSVDTASRVPERWAMLTPYPEL
ncbi:MAG: protein ImuB [Solirubrobacterales bacterium]|jgi:protein ImuB|nr:protein ImuB [Solirubrobacterales bacterium]